MQYLTTEERRKRLFEIMDKINRLNKEADELLEGNQSQSALPLETATVAIPTMEDFSQTDAIKAVIASTGERGIEKRNIAKHIFERYGVKLNESQVQSTVAYLKNTKKEIESAGYGRYKIVTK